MSLACEKESDRNHSIACSCPEIMLKRRTERILKYWTIHLRDTVVITTDSFQGFQLQYFDKIVYIVIGDL